VEGPAESVVVDRAYEAYRFELLAHLRSITRDGQAAEDLLHESYVRLITELRNGRAPLNARAWLFTVARNLAFSRGRRHEVAMRKASELPRPASVRSAEDQYVDVEALHFMGALLADIDATDRLCLLMAAHGYGSAEIARRVGSTSNAVRTRMCRARQRLRAKAEASHARSGGRLAA
jgi:RNA polymerase sigma-70 factor (ECF subfamily)